MALMVFLAMMGMFTTYYVPIWMEENEAEHMMELQSQFGELKSSLDQLILHNNKNLTLYSTINLGSAGVPVFAESTAGRLELSPQEEVLDIRFMDSGQYVNETAQGRLRVIVPNRYFVAQSVVYSGGGLIIWQNTGMFMKVRPNFMIENISGEIAIRQTLVSLVNLKDQNAQHSGIAGVNANLLYVDEWTYTNVTSETVYMNITSVYAEAWEKHYNSTFQIGGLSPHDYSLKLNMTESAVNRYDRLEIEIKNVAYYSLNHAFVRMYLDDDVSAVT